MFGLCRSIMWIYWNQRCDRRWCLSAIDRQHWYLSIQYWGWNLFRLRTTILWFVVQLLLPHFTISSHRSSCLRNFSFDFSLLWNHLLSNKLSIAKLVVPFCLLDTMVHLFHIRSNAILLFWEFNHLPVEDRIHTFHCSRWIVLYLFYFTVLLATTDSLSQQTSRRQQPKCRRWSHLLC